MQDLGWRSFDKEREESKGREIKAEKEDDVFIEVENMDLNYLFQS